MKLGAIFDMDGTLLDTERVYWNNWLKTADEFGVERNEKLPAAMSGSNLKSVPDIMKNFYPEVDAMKYVERVIERAKAEFEKNLVVKNGVVEILEYFSSEKIPMAVASSSRIDTIEKHLQRTGLAKYFSAFVSGDQVENGKPAPDIFLKAAEKINIPANDCYIFEDSFNGIRAAATSGGAAILIIDCVQPTEEIKKICAGVYDDMHGALNAIRKYEL